MLIICDDVNVANTCCYLYFTISKLYPILISGFESLEPTLIVCARPGCASVLQPCLYLTAARCNNVTHTILWFCAVSFMPSRRGAQIAMADRALGLVVIALAAGLVVIALAAGAVL